MLDVNKIRGDFPIYYSDKPFVYLDSASTTQKPQVVIDAVSSYYNSYAANIHRALYETGERATDAYEQVRIKVKQFLNVPNTHSVIFTRSTTESINLVAYAWGLKNLSQHDTVFISEMEHHSNLVPWQLITEKIGATLNYIPLTDNGTLNIESLDQLTDQTKLVSVGHQSNVFGTVNSVNEIISAAKNVNAVTVLDGAQAASHMKVNITELDCDFYAFSGHKMVGPTGVGVLIGRTDLLESMDPFMGGGEMINTVTLVKSTWNDVPWKFEAGTPNIAQAIGLSKSIDYINKLGLDNIKRYEEKLLNHLLSKLRNIEGINIFGHHHDSGPIVSFDIKGYHPYDIAKLLDGKDICIRSGHHCTQILMKHLKVNYTNRISLFIYNSKEEIDFFINHLLNIIKILK